MYISEVSERSGLSTHTLRYYEKEGLLENIQRDATGKRVYSENDLSWVGWIQRLKSTGMSLEDIKTFSALRLMGDASLSDRKNMLIEHAKRLKSDIQRLTDELDIVEYKIDAYRDKEKKHLT